MTMERWYCLVASLMPLAGCTDRQTRGEPPALLAQERVALAARDPVPRPLRYFVDPAGSDQNSGTSASPWKTIQRAAVMAGAGDTVIVRPGRYTGAERIVSLDQGGTPDAWITFRSERKWGAVLDGRDGTSVEAWYFGPDVGYVSIEGFEIRQLHDHGFNFYGGGVHDVVIA